MVKSAISTLVLGVLLCSCTMLKKTTGKIPDESSNIKSNAGNIDTTKSGTNQIKPYKDIVTAKAITDSGLIIIHKVDERYYFEIPHTLLNREILTVNRIAKAATEGWQEFFGYAGDQIGENIIQLSQGVNNKVFIKRISYHDKSTDSTKNGMYWAVRNSNVQPIIAAFDVKAYGQDSSSIVIDITDYINGDNNDVLFFNNLLKKNIASIGAYHPDKSYIQKINSFPNNVEIRTVKTFVKEVGNSFLTFTYELNSSLVLLPEKPLPPRYEDNRIGYFSRGFLDYDDPKGAKPKYMITRWRLEPKKEDIGKYKKGELVEPQKPIVFYIDPATPKKWVPYLIQGVNEWQKAFEKAGFKNAIYALEAPANDSTWSLEDARHNAIIYKASAIPNAYGPQVSDPRSGEILEAHIQWFHNVIKLLHGWYIIQAGPNDPKGRKMQFDDTLMGKLICYVATHEVGHTLGLTHNFGASSTVPVEYLRNKKWVEKNGFCPSIMDYARFNYVAQPEDSVNEKGIFPRIGSYDEWAIEWGYKWLGDFSTKEEEVAFLNRWVINKLSNDKRLWYGGANQATDSRCQPEDLGDNAIKASEYGIKNLKRVMTNLVEWAKEPNSSYENLSNMQQQVIAQFQQYLLHVSKIIASWQGTLKTVEQDGPLYEFSSRKQQKAAVKFLQEQLFTTPEWTINKKIFFLVSGNGYLPLIRLQQDVLEQLLSINTMGVLLYFETMEPQSAYTVAEYLDDLRKGIMREINEKKFIDLYRRNLQKAYVAQLLSLQDALKDPSANGFNNTDAASLIKRQLKEILNEVRGFIPSCRDKMTELHLLDVKERLTEALARRGTQTTTTPSRPAINEMKVKPGFDLKNNLLPLQKITQKERSCWEYGSN